jgi:hypothetical protein
VIGGQRTEVQGASVDVRTILSPQSGCALSVQAPPISKSRNSPHHECHQSSESVVF